MWALPAVAFLILALTLVPAETWHAPALDAVYKGFDSNLMYATGGGSGQVEISSNTIKLIAVPDSQPSVNLATWPLEKLSASVEVSVLESSAATDPFRIGVWTPWTNAGYFVVFEPGADHRITADAIELGQSGATLAGGTVVRSIDLGGYDLGKQYRLDFLVDKVRGLVSATVSPGARGKPATASVDAQVLPALFRSVRLSLTASATGGRGGSTVILSDYTLALPHQRFWASRVDDLRVRIALSCLAIAATLVLMVAMSARLRGRSVPHLSEWIRTLMSEQGSGITKRWRVVALLVGSIGTYLVGNALLFPLGGDPFDIHAEKLFAYVAQTNGPAQLYYLPNVVSLAQIWHGIPIEESGFPYEPVFAYLALAIGWLSHLVVGGTQFRLESIQLEYLIKSVNVLFGLVDTALIYAILRHIGMNVGWSLGAAGLFLFNPAVWFSMSVWGQTHVISLCFVLATVWFAEKNRPLLAWLAVAAACLTRPQMLVFGLLLGIVLLRRFSWPRNLFALSWTVIIAFLALLPFTLVTSPSLPVDIMLNNFRIQEAGGNEAAFTPVSQGAYSVWPLVTYIVQGASGELRSYIPSSQTLVGPLTYRLMSQILAVAALLVLSAVLVMRRRSAFESGGYLPIVALGITSFLMLLTTILSTHFLLALPLLLLCRRWMGSVAFFYIAAVWTITTFVAMYGEMGSVLSAQDYLLLAPSKNAVTAFFVNLYTWDRFITVAVIANVCAMLWLAFLIVRPLDEHSPSRPAAAA